MNTLFKIRELRKSVGLTQTQLAESLGLESSSAVTMWENGSRKPSSTMLPRIAKILGCSIDELYNQPQDNNGNDDEGGNNHGTAT